MSSWHALLLLEWLAIAISRYRRYCCEKYRGWSKINISVSNVKSWSRVSRLVL